LLDFGVAKIIGDREEKVTGIDGCLGTPEYMAPEQLRTASDIDGRADVWSLGVVLYELLTGKTPYTGSLLNVVAGIAADPVPDPRRTRPALPEALAAVILRMLEKDPDRRIKTMGDVVDALAPFGPAERVSAALAAVPRTVARIGEILVANGVVTSSQLDAAVEVQRNTDRRLGRVLVDLGFLDAADLMAALAKQESGANSLAPPPPPPPPARTRRVARPETRRLPKRGRWALIAIVALGVLGAAALGASSGDDAPRPTETAR
jgi:hypothetical protein